MSFASLFDLGVHNTLPAKKEWRFVGKCNCILIRCVKRVVIRETVTAK